MTYERVNGEWAHRILLLPSLCTPLRGYVANASLIVSPYPYTAECGDFVEEDYPDHTYLSTFKFVPQQDSDLERRIMENHKKHM